jgi:hypothetical protein
MQICYAGFQTLHGAIVSQLPGRIRIRLTKMLRIHANPEPQHCFQKEKKISKNVNKYKILAPNFVSLDQKTLIKLKVFPVDFYGMVLAEKPTDLLPHLGQVLIMASVIM